MWQRNVLTTVLGEAATRVGQDRADFVAARLAKLQAVHERMRKVNTLVRYRDSQGLKRLGFADSRVIRLLQAANGERRYAFYTDDKLFITHLQIMALRRLARELETAERTDVHIDQERYQYREDSSEETISFKFAAKPDKALRALLRRAGFVLRPSRNAYERHLDCAGIAAASRLRAYLNDRKQ